MIFYGSKVKHRRPMSYAGVEDVMRSSCGESLLSSGMACHGRVNASHKTTR